MSTRLLAKAFGVGGNMKQTTKSAIFAAAIAMAAAFLLSLLVPHQAKAQATGGAEQYKVVLTDKYQSLPQLEQQLNTLGADGWKARTAVGSMLVFAK